jgi:cell division protein FtsI (penicillin-binding protein 3)
MNLGRPGRRLSFIFIAVCILLLVIGGRLVQLQGLDHANYADAAAAQRVSTVPLHALRGEIVDRNGAVLAYTDDAQDITADPTQVPVAKRPAYAARLAPLLKVSGPSILTALGAKGHYALLASALPPTTAGQVSALNLPGIYTQATTQRQYPAQSTAGNVVGLVHSDGTGAAGIEYQYNDILAGKDGTETYAVDGAGNANPSGPDKTVPAQNGGTVALTLDEDLQYTVQHYLDSAVNSSGARGGQVAILSKTGQVLALASNGTFNPADPSSITADTALDPPVQSVFEPGSVNKVVTFSAAIEKGLITPSSHIMVPGYIDMGGVTVHDDWVHNPVMYTATGILAQSSNVGTLEIAQKLGPSAWDAYEKKFGIGTPTGIELPGESAGILPDMKDWSGSSFANLPIGQGEAMTVLQLASMYQTVANGGVRVPPRIVSSVTKSDGSQQATAQPAGIRVITPTTAATVRKMLESVTLAGGTGTKAAIPGYRVAGKTGTAQQPDPAHGGAYSSWMNWDTFAGMAPSDNPQFEVAIMVDNPAHGLQGGDVAAPLFNEIATYELKHAKVPPTGSQSTHVPLMVCSPEVIQVYGRTVC